MYSIKNTTNFYRKLVQNTLFTNNVYNNDDDIMYPINNTQSSYNEDDKFIHKIVDQSTFRIRLCDDIWRYILEFVDKSNPRFIWEYKLTTNIYFTFPYKTRIVKTTFYIDNQHTLNECISYYNKKPKKTSYYIDNQPTLNDNKKITLFLGPGIFTIPPLGHHFDIYGCYSNRTTINQTISVLNSNCSLHHLILINQKRAVYAKYSELLIDDCLINNCKTGLELINSKTIVRSSYVCSNDVPVILKDSGLTFEKCEYLFNKNEIKINESLTHKGTISKVIFDKDCSVLQEGSLLTSLKHEIHRKVRDNDMDYERWSERILSVKYNDINKIYIFFTYLSSLYMCDPNNFHFTAETKTICNLEKDDYYDDDNMSDIIDFENCNCITFTENRMSTDIFRNIVLKIFSNSCIKSINISQMDYKWLRLLKIYYHSLRWKELRWMHSFRYYRGNTFYYRHKNLWEIPFTHVDEAKPFWEVFKIKYVNKLFKQAGFFVEDGEIFIKSTKTNSIDVPHCFDTKSDGVDKRNHLLKDKKNRKINLVRREREKIRFLKYMKRKKKKRRKI
tara:strand:+ start:7913 stop:9589 length:1677 start_codon:yes stop_codon:yes gene_type:complete